MSMTNVDLLNVLYGRHTDYERLNIPCNFAFQNTAYSINFLLNEQLFIFKKIFLGTTN